MLQQFSIDECFIDMSLRCAGKDPVAIATQLKDEIKARLGFTVNVGVGSSKLLSKMASDFEKPDKVHTLWATEVQEKMWPRTALGRQEDGREAPCLWDPYDRRPGPDQHCFPDAPGGPEVCAAAS